MAGSLKTTPVWGRQQAAGARPGVFAGWQLPLEFHGLAREVQAVRCRAGLFDVSHMGEITVKGQGAAALLQMLLTNDIQGLAPGRARYTLMCAADGGILEDLIVYCPGPAEYLLVVNAANTARDLAWLKENAGSNTEVQDRSNHCALLALQGPRATEILEGATGVSLAAVRPFALVRARLAGEEAWLSRTGYTGEDGWEIFLSPGAAGAAWDLLSGGKEPRPEPCGLAARDVLRLEAGLPLYGQELNPGVTPLEADLMRFVKLEKEFVGKEAVRKQMAQGPSRRLAGLKLKGRGVPRPGYAVWQEGRRVGEVTSGTFSPTLEAGLAMAYLEADSAAPGFPVQVEIRERRQEALTVELPFYRKGDAACTRKTGATPGSTSGF